MAHHPKCYVQVDSATAWATSYGSVGSVGCRICDWIVEIEQDAIANMTAEWMSNHGDRWEFSAGQQDMLERCEQAAFTDLLGLEDDIREPLGKGSDAERIVAGYRSSMPFFQRLHYSNSITRSNE